MEAQLRLLSPPRAIRPPVTPLADAGEPTDDLPPELDPSPTTWRLSASTRAVGRRGIESARAALRQARSTSPDGAEGDAGTGRRSAA